MLERDSRCLLPSPVSQLPQELEQRLTAIGIVPQSCDLASGLFNPSRQAMTRREVLRLNEMNRQPLFTLTHDSTQPLEGLLGGNFHAFRTSMMPGLKYKGEQLMPAFLNEAEFDEWTPLTASGGPTVGFVGQGHGELQHEMISFNSDDAVKRYGLERISGDQPLKHPINIGLIMRQRVISGLSVSKAVTSNIVVRQINHAHLKGDLSRLRTEYLENMNQNLFALCVRGVGNYSMRLYEALAMGRIPVIIDETMPLPLSGHIDWSALAVKVPIGDIDSVGEIVAAFFDSKTPEELIQMQHATRQTWLDFLTRTNFFVHALTAIAQDSKID